MKMMQSPQTDTPIDRMSDYLSPKFHEQFVSFESKNVHLTREIFGLDIVEQ